jgi:hypothetical protein
MPSKNPVEIEEAKQQPQPVQAKKPYKKPAFRYERVFETQALSCGKVVGTQCGSNRKSS